MVELTHGLFRVILLTPRAKLLDCRAGSLVVPAHDGQRGILRNHCPMLAKLTLGILEVRQILDRPDAFYIIEGGFVRVTENHVTVLAYDAMTFEGMEPSQVQQLISDAQSVLVGKEYIRTQRGQVDVRRSRLIVRMAQLAGIETTLAESPS
ncbi:MAG TPA: ATP synthase F1 subunit epsilon [Anaerohalosphaeraceae bacterium]|nr:ATP synthase F1 subunit epsilon [Anaerohalosphaeraceae bacterium]